MNLGNEQHAMSIRQPMSLRGYFLYLEDPADGRESWTAPQSVNPAGSASASRGYFDLKALPDGAVAAIWLEGDKLNEEKGRGSFLKFAISRGNAGFEAPITLSRHACQCCKTKLFVDSRGKLHVLYREIYADGARDIAHTVSANGGKSFSPSQNISLDKWYLQGCPHVGPDMAETKEGLQFSWFSKGGSGGIYGSSMAAGSSS